MSRRTVIPSRVLLVGIMLSLMGWVAAVTGADAVPRPSHGKGGAVGTFANETIDIDGQSREYRLVVPQSVDGVKPVPVLFADVVKNSVSMPVPKVYKIRSVSILS